MQDMSRMAIPVYQVKTVFVKLIDRGRMTGHRWAPPTWAPPPGYTPIYCVIYPKYLCNSLLCLRQAFIRANISLIIVISSWLYIEYIQQMSRSGRLCLYFRF